MAACTCENWTLKDLALALKDMHKENKVIVVPMFQRGKRWKKNQEEVFIDSLEKSYPVGTMLFYRTVEGTKEIYTLIDGLQRGNTIKKYMASPTQFFSKQNIPTDMINTIYEVLGYIGDEVKIKERILEIMTTHIQKLDSLRGVQYYPIANDIVKELDISKNKPVDKIIAVIEPFMRGLQDMFDKISNMVIPVIVYSGSEDTLPEIFERINSRGTPLSTYEVYAASWPINKKFKVENTAIVDRVLRKYDYLADDDFNILGYDREDMRKNRMLNAFEYVFGIGKFLNDKYEFLRFENSLKDDEINTMGFELLNACINDSNDKIKVLYAELLKLDINLFEIRLIEAIEFVGKIIAKITNFKGNMRKQKEILHSKYQILSMVSTTFKTMYALQDMKTYKQSWEKDKIRLKDNMIHHYINDILRDEWSNGGTSKIHRVAKPNKYLSQIPKKVWESTLNAYFEQNNMRQEVKNIAHPKKEDRVFLNCIYLPVFSALDQLSLDKFDIEHIATKESMRGLIAQTKSNGLPISSIANLCYLPEKVNRCKGEKTFYQDVNYQKYINLNEVERKYSFTKEEELEWLSLPYNENDREALKEYYMGFLTKRFKRQKEMFYTSMGIVDEEDNDNEKEECAIEENDCALTGSVIISPMQSYEKVTERNTPSNFHKECVEIINEKLSTKLVKKSRSVYISEDEKIGIAISVSKKYTQGDRPKYWFAYRTIYSEKTENCTKRYIAYACENEENILLLPIDLIEENKHKLNHTEKEGKIHWHIVIFKNDDGTFVWQHSNPTLTEIDVTKYIV